MRLTSAEIDQGILDVAAGIFAQHGYAHTSVQQVADAVGYSKAGLLHRFGSKEAMYLAGLEEGTHLVESILEGAGTLPFDERRTQAILEIFTAQAMAHPGMVQMLLRAFEPSNDGPGKEQIRELGYRLLALLNPPFSTAAERLRVVLAMQLIVNAALAQSHDITFDVTVAPDQLIPMVVDLSLLVLDEPTAVRSVS
ncbi:MAG TPA: helix-turn-helix domain-containing protein [Nocardioidaceae bacterium]|nr:helix-turn-helix domain-containing protein [Nocardioidaceae bacterium]